MKCVPRSLLPFLAAGALWPVAPAPRPAAGAGATPPADEFFEKKVRPVLVQHCYECHSAAGKKSKGGMRLDTRDGPLKGSAAGPPLLPGDPDKSLLARAVPQTDKDLRMPPKQKLSAAQIADLASWVKAG